MQDKGGPKAGSEEGQFSVVLYSPQNLVPRRNFPLRFMQQLQPSLVSSVISMFPKIRVEKEGNEEVSNELHLCRSDWMQLQTYPASPCLRVLFTFVYFLPPRFHRS